MSETDESPLLDFLEDDSFKTPAIGSKKHPEGKVYTIESPDAETGIRLSALGEIGVKLEKGVEVSARDIARLNISDEDEREFSQQILGDTLQEMIDDGVSWVRIKRLTTYSYVRFAFSEEVANDAAKRGVFSGKVPARNRAERRAAERNNGGAHKAPQDSTGSRELPRVM